MPRPTHSEAIATVLAADVPHPIKGTLLVLAGHYPRIHATQERLAWERGIGRSTLNRHLRQLESSGLIRRRQRTGTSTVYFLNLRAIRTCRGAATEANPSRVTAPASTPPDLPF